MVYPVTNGAGKVLLWSTNLDSFLIDAIQALKIDWVFYAGDWQNALVLVRQLKAISASNPLPEIMLSDAAMDSRLLTLEGRDMEDVYLSFPISHDRFEAEEGYAVYGKDARGLIISQINKTGVEFDVLAGEGGGVGLCYIRSRAELWESARHI